MDIEMVDRKSFFPPEALILSIDAMGGDHGANTTIPGLSYALTNQPDLAFVVHGDESVIEPLMSQYPDLKKRCQIVHTTEVVLMDEKPAQVIRRRGTSMLNAILSVKMDQAKACVSAGNTGALMALSKMQLKMMTKNLERPPIACSWPSIHGLKTVLDVGANVHSDSQQLIEFALMGVAFHRALHGTENPVVGLLNVGSEDMKGHDEVREAHRLLKMGVEGISYHGFVEGDDLCMGEVNVIVTDGFTGNIALKTAEGVARFIKTLLKEALKDSILGRIGAFIAQGALKKMAKKIDPGSANGGPLLGLNGIVVKSHGGADARSFANAVLVASSLARRGYLNDINKALTMMGNHKLNDCDLSAGSTTNG
jgi:glycerol-3-phosphate acyltransferase PlsX